MLPLFIRLIVQPHKMACSTTTYLRHSWALVNLRTSSRCREYADSFLFKKKLEVSDRSQLRGRSYPKSLKQVRNRRLCSSGFVDCLCKNIWIHDDSIYAWPVRYIRWINTIINSVWYWYVISESQWNLRQLSDIW